MRILIAHNYYQQSGGEDTLFHAERDLLRARGHEVLELVAHNDDVAAGGKLASAVRSVWSRESAQRVKQMIADFKPEVAHFNNTFVRLSPSVLHAAHDAGVATVQTLYNYRQLCPKAIFFRDGKVCEDCLGKTVQWPAVVHKCYRSALGSTAIAATNLLHDTIGTWRNKVNQFVTLTNFAKAKFVQGGFDSEQIFVKPACIEDRPHRREGPGEVFLFIGRITQDKGVLTLADAWAKLPQPRPQLWIVGDGPAMGELRDRIVTQMLERDITLLGKKTQQQISEMMPRVRSLIVPSLWYETFGRVAIEAFVANVPAISSDIGAIGEVVVPGESGLHYRTGDADDLAKQVLTLWRDPRLAEELGWGARRQYERLYTEATNYEQLMELYTRAITRRQGDHTVQPAAPIAAV